MHIQNRTVILIRESVCKEAVQGRLAVAQSVHMHCLAPPTHRTAQTDPHGARGIPDINIAISIQVNAWRSAGEKTVGEIVRAMIDATSAVEHLHMNNYMHRDVTRYNLCRDQDGKVSAWEQAR